MRIPAEAAQYIRKGVPLLGQPNYPSPLLHSSKLSLFLPDSSTEDCQVLLSPFYPQTCQGSDSDPRPLAFEQAGPRKSIYFNPAEARAAIVTCGGLCPGLNDVIRSLVLTLTFHYGVNEIHGIRYGFSGMVDSSEHPPVRLTPELIEPISNEGGSYLGTSRGNQDPAEMVEFLRKRSINILFCIGGDGTQKGALAISHAAEKIHYPLSVIGLPKTIDNDIGLVERTFGFETAVAVAGEVLRGAHVEATAEYNGVVIVKLMGRQSGFLAAYASIASGDVNFLLIPEVKFDLDGPGGFIEALKSRLSQRHHALVVVAEGVAETLLPHQKDCCGVDASGNKIYDDIGIYLKDQVARRFKQDGFKAKVRYIDPSYLVRSLRANASDSVYCQMLGQNAVHAAMSGRTKMIVATCHRIPCHIPTEAAVLERKFVDPQGPLWRTAVETTGQRVMRNEGIDD